MDEPYTFPWEDPFKTQSVLEQRNKSTISCNSYDLIEDDDIPIQMSPKRRSIDIVFSILSRSISPSSPPPPPTTTTLHQDSSIDNFDFLPPPSHPFSRSSSNTSASSSNPYLPSSPPRTPNKLSKRDRYFSSLTSRNRKKLIISGITATQVKKFEGVKRWCESFGELRSITRLPNGDLQIDFKDPEVADTVCRVRAKVFIAGVGSVHLSWIICKR